MAPCFVLIAFRERPACCSGAEPGNLFHHVPLFLSNSLIQNRPALVTDILRSPDAIRSLFALPPHNPLRQTRLRNIEKNSGAALNTSTETAFSPTPEIPPWRKE